MDLVHGVDVSKWEPHVDWRTLRAHGFRFALIRATSSLSYVDPKFAEHWTGARNAGILRGAYHYLFGGQDAKTQAESFIATVGSDKGELPPIVDLEDAYNEGVPNSKLISACKTFLDIIEKEFGRTPMIYSRKTYLDLRATINGKAPAWAKNYELWVAQYPWEFNPDSMPNVNMPKQPVGWKDWKFWQYSENAIVEGVTDDLNRPTQVDLNWFRGSEADLYRFADVQPAEAQTYTIQSGDTFKSIAEKHSLSLTELLDANPSLLQVGSTLNIPGQIEIPEPPDGDGSDPSTQPQDTPGETGGGTVDAQPERIHIVLVGDTLSGIALRYRTTIDAILLINPQITNRNIIFDGQVIKIP